MTPQIAILLSLCPAKRCIGVSQLSNRQDKSSSDATFLADNPQEIPHVRVQKMPIHPSTIVSPTASIGHDVAIGPFCVIEAGAVIGDRCQLASHVVVKSGTTLGRDNQIDSGTVLGGRPQHLAAGQEIGTTVIGDRNQIREYVTIHHGLRPGQTTTLGSDNLLMVSSHIGHDCHVGDHNLLTNNVMLGGHVIVEDRVCFGGASGVHQFCRIGSSAMIGGMAKVTRDVPPFVLVDGDTATMVGLNSIGLRRSGMTGKDLRVLKQAYRIAFRSDRPFEDRVAELRATFDSGPARDFWEFLSGPNKRGFSQDRRGPSKRSYSGQHDGSLKNSNATAAPESSSLPFHDKRAA